MYPYFPGDPAVARFIQALAPAMPLWAQLVTATAKTPWNVLLVGGSMLLAWWMAGWRAAALALVSFAGLWLVGPWVNSLIGRPRPSAELVRVVGTVGGYSAPSIFGLTYGAVFLFLALLSSLHTEGRIRRWAPIACGVVLVVGGCARIALGAHWPSDITLSYLIAYCWTAALVMVLSARS